MKVRVNSIGKYFFDRFEYLLISVVLPISWLVFEKYFYFVSRKNSFLPPVKNRFKSATIYVHDTNYIIPAQHSLLALKSATSWARSTLKIMDVKISSNSTDIDSEVVIITGDWFKSTKPHLKLFIPAFKLARKIKKQNLPIWFLAGDTYNLHLIIAASILVSRCGGAVVLQQNTRDEALEFGIPFPSGPHLWLFNPDNIYLFQSEIKWEDRDNLILFAATGDDKRRNFLDQSKDYLTNLGWAVVPGNQQFDWVGYRDLNKKTNINVTLSLRQSAVEKRLRFLKNRASEFTVSSRVFEGFCSGSVVVTNVNPVLSVLGFESGVHYLDVTLMQNPNFSLPNNDLLKSIAISGNELFLSIINNKV